VDARLLPGAHADHLPVVAEAHRVGLRVFEGDRRHDEGLEDVVRDGGITRGTRPVGICRGAGGADAAGGVRPAGAGCRTRPTGNDTRGEEVLRDARRVPLLGQGETEDLARLGVGGLIVGVDLQDDVGAVTLALEQVEGLRLVARGDDQVGDLVVEQAGEGHVDDVANGGDVAERAHAVAAASASVRGGDRRVVGVRKELRGAIDVRKRSGDGGAGRTHVLERGGARLAGRCLELAHELPGTQGVEEVDVPRPSAKYLEARLVGDPDAGRRLVRVAAVLECDVHAVSLPRAADARQNGPEPSRSVYRCRIPRGVRIPVVSASSAG